MKRFLLLTLSLTLLLIFPAQTLASVPPSTSRTISEYDMICQERTTARNNVQSGLMTAQEAAQLKIFKVEDELLRLASLPSQDLASMGYTASQIAILKAYKGGPLEDHPEMRAVTPAAESIWAKCGKAAICVNRTGTATFSEAKFGFCYGHEYISIVPTITCSTNPISVSFSSGITTMCLDTRRFSASGVELD